MRYVDPPLRLLVVGEGTQLGHMRRLTEELGLADRVEFAGAVSDDRLVELYAGAASVVYVPYDEDYGYVTLESFLARKPLVTTRDSGGPLEFVEDGVSGLVTEPAPEAIADAVNRLQANPLLGAALSDAAYERARGVTWDGVIDKLLSHL
jgi:glycosyltransferase involved in cell wall biosynthesis